MTSPSAVAIIETPHSFIVEGRPDRPGQLAYAGKLQLFGGHSEEAPSKTIRRELHEELDLNLAVAPEILWAGVVESRNRAGDEVERYVSLFRVCINSVAELNLKIPGEIVEIPRNEIALQDYIEELTPFAFSALQNALNGLYDSVPR